MKIIILAFLLTACSSLPAFKKASENEFGYSIKNSSDRRDIFDVHAALPEAVSPEFRADYLIRAAGEECLSRGFLFWDVGGTSANSTRAFCYKQQSKKSIGVLLSTKNPKKLVVEDTLPNSYSPFRSNDVVRKIGGTTVGNIGEFKEQIFRLAEGNQKQVTVAMERSGIALSLEAPFSEQSEALFTPEMLEGVRKKLP